MLVVRKLDSFDPSTSVWVEYRDRAKLYFTMNGIPSDKQTAVFLTCCGPETYSLQRGLLAQDCPKFSPHLASTTPLVYRKWWQVFLGASEREGDRDYLASLKKLVEVCNFATFQKHVARPHSQRNR
ncbi:hypothetical protein HPB50_000834 [Hyalomma asiaticum]|uniref:Uncharacterized protein n=1 Tax=Hyalomma asiaticum TaxID=266040 RepID=A0ACB7S213_HYAAI|nr:hypothetical protein HPB50_000834 [Hyalomma asiaticum]